MTPECKYRDTPESLQLLDELAKKRDQIKEKVLHGFGLAVEHESDTPVCDSPHIADDKDCPTAKLYRGEIAADEWSPFI